MPTGPRKARPDDRLRIEPGISRFRIRVCDAPRNDGPRNFFRHCERQRSNPALRKASVDCFVAFAPRNDEFEPIGFPTGKSARSPQDGWSDWSAVAQRAKAEAIPIMPRATVMGFAKGPTHPTLAVERLLICCMANQIRTIELRQTDPTGKSLLIIRNRVKPRNQKYFCFHLPQIRCISKPVSSHQRGVARRHERGAGCGGRKGVRRAGQSQGEMNLVSGQRRAG